MRDGLEGFNAVGDMLFKRNTKLLGSTHNVFSADVSGEAALPHFFEHGVHFDLGQSARRTGVGHGENEPTKLIYGIESFGQEGGARNMKILRMASDRLDHLRRPALFGEHFHAD